MDCCHCQGIEAHFDQQKAVKKLELYREAGLPAFTFFELIISRKPDWSNL